ncbi:hypothetical protein [uncultured Microbacterium sp.]|uniref:hypothetical protein n=1 Tax=uncultured Microbacterium sp. TaxID=191216 RepID=UPI0025D23179|nr:hypothetical protein [uncultured Microbacterium sp.]
MPVEWVVGIFGFLGVIVTALLTYVGTRGKTQTDAIAARFNDASDLSKYIREQIEAEVERQVAPIRTQLESVKRESHEMHDAVRARETQLWFWDQRGRQGELPLLPTPILERLGLQFLITGWNEAHPTIQGDTP